jgi:hypothetical protein
MTYYVGKLDPVVMNGKRTEPHCDTRAPSGARHKEYEISPLN